MTDTTTITTDLAQLVDGHLAALSEPDEAVRLATLRDLWSDAGQMADPPITGEGPDGIAAIGAALQQQFPGHAFRRTTAVDAHHGFLRYGWDLVDPGGAAVLSGTDVGVVGEEGRLARIVGFFGPLAERED